MSSSPLPLCLCFIKRLRPWRAKSRWNLDRRRRPKSNGRLCPEPLGIRRFHGLPMSLEGMKDLFEVLHGKDLFEVRTPQLMLLPVSLFLDVLRLLRELHAKVCWATWRVRMQPCKRSFGRNGVSENIRESPRAHHVLPFAKCSILFWRVIPSSDKLMSLFQGSQLPFQLQELERTRARLQQAKNRPSLVRIGRFLPVWDIVSLILWTHPHKISQNFKVQHIRSSNWFYMCNTVSKMPRCEAGINRKRCASEKLTQDQAMTNSLRSGLGQLWAKQICWTSYAMPVFSQDKTLNLRYWRNIMKSVMHHWCESRSVLNLPL